ncbi:MAG: amidohydrolase family protein [Planctomycetes bacterium]|nr:amidohydrolase family protein [Planctomycetota bacterium]
MLRNGGPAYTMPEDLIRRCDSLGIEKAVILPGVSPECVFVPQGVQDVLDICAAWPDRFIPFCNIDPRAMTNSPEAPLGEMLAFFKAAGCRGVGEITANLRMDDPLVLNLFKHCSSRNMPVTFHLAASIGGTYGLYDEPGLPLLENALAAFPELVFLGHSQVFWAEMAPLRHIDDRKGYPAYPVESEGRTVELFRRHANLHGDLSANSGFNAVSRDREFGIAFLNEFQDRLYFGTDICAPGTPTPLVDYLLELRRNGAITESVFSKIARENAIRLLGL